MRIISKFHDYYDGVQAYGQDRSLIFLRKMEVVQEDIPFYGGFYDWFGDVTYSAFVVYFCGRVYPGILIEVSGDSLRGRAEAKRYCYSANECREFLQANKVDLKKLFHPRLMARHFTDESVEEFFQLNSRQELAVFQKYECPILVTGYRGFYATGLSFEDSRFALFKHITIKCPHLKTLEFFRVVDANQAFQSIQMFLSGVLGTSTPPMVAVSEKTRIAKRGFDKWSFRKHPDQGK